MRKRKKTEYWGYIFLVPWFLFFLIFTAYPLVYGLVVSFYDYTLTRSVFVGLQNYVDMLGDLAFRRSVLGTLLYAAIILPCTVILSLFIANALSHRGTKCNAVTKAVFYLPSVTSQVALVVVWNFLFAPTFGFVAKLFTVMGLTPISWFDNAGTAIPLMALLVLAYSLGQPIILYAAAINGIPDSYFEAAKIDGASNRQVFFRITLPLLHSTTTYILITSTIGALQIFAIPYLMTGGGPNNKTSTLLLIVYKSAFLNGNFGYASAIGIVLCLITALIAVLQFRALRRENVEY